jgi:5'-nucleotidase
MTSYHEPYSVASYFVFLQYFQYKLVAGGIMNILLCNDDGIEAPGIISMAKQLCKLGKVTVAAPDSERSAASNSLTLASPLRVRRVDFPADVEDAYAISGMPADCAKIALTTLLEDKPDVVVSGINRGPNMCVDVFYSGTVAAAFEGAFKGILAFAVSLDSFELSADFGVAAERAAKCIKKMVDKKVPVGYVYNINLPAIPSDEIKGTRITRQGKVDYNEKYIRREDPYGKPYYWIQGNPEIVDEDNDCDIVAVKSGFISITPLKTTLTDFDLKEKMEKLGF